jgi:phosphoribosylformylglycinamidine synthase
MLVPFYLLPPAQRHSFEECLYFDIEEALMPHQLNILLDLIAQPLCSVSLKSTFSDAEVVEIGPRLSVETPFSSSAVAICKSVGLPVRRVEKSTRYHANGDTVRSDIIREFLDPMTQEVYASGLTSFDSGKKPEPVRTIRILEQGESVLREANKALGLGMDNSDITYYAKLFAELGRNPTDMELFQIGNMNSEHSRHGYFRGIQIIDGIEMPESLMDIVRAPWKQHPNNSLVAFRDNSGVIRGTDVEVFMPSSPGQPSAFGTNTLLQHITATAETHNHPTLIAPFPGAATGAGGRIRDSRAVGRGGLVHAGLAGYCVGNLHISDYQIPGENIGGEESRRSASPLRILIEGSNGVSQYGNEDGEPLIGGFTHSFGQIVGGERREFRKPVLYSAGMGRLLDIHLEKRPPNKKMFIVRIGGPAYRIGVGGGSASSMTHGSQDEGLDLMSVQRGNAEMENRVNRVIQACAELLDNNPIESIHDQGAGGPSNVLTELMEPQGGRVNIREIIVGDQTMSLLAIWVAEFQEGYGLLVWKENLEVLQGICERERVNCEVLGTITGDGNVVVYDPVTNTTPVNLSLKDVLSGIPRKQYTSEHIRLTHEPLVIPPDLTVDDALQMVFRLPAVGSKGFLVHKVDRSVTGLVARQQCCGPTQVPVADVAVTADGYFGITGAATALGEKPNIMLVSPAAGARMAVAEMLTNLASARITKLSDVKCRANWMWAAKRAGQGALLYDAAVAMRDIMLRLGIAIDGGKDSLSMATQVEDTPVVSPGELVIMGYAPVPDITKVVTPNLTGAGILGHFAIGGPFRRLGASALAQALGQVGDDVPDLDSTAVSYLGRVFEAAQELIQKELITACHDISEGGLITTLAEMCIAGNRGARVTLEKTVDPLSTLFSEEAGLVVEYAPDSRRAISHVMSKYSVFCDPIGIVDSYPTGSLVIRSGTTSLLDRSVAELRQWWESTSTQLEKLQANPDTVESERRTHSDKRMLTYHLSFTPTAPALDTTSRRPKAAILREEGTNGDREMAAAFYTAGFDVYDLTMSDLLTGGVSFLDEYRGLIFPGGFSYADTFGSAKGWAGPIRFNSRLRERFDRFYERPDTFSLGVCNGCQLMASIGWLPRKNIPPSAQPQLVPNRSGRFESRWAGVKILESPSILFRRMEESVLGIWVAHGEGQFLFPDPHIADEVWLQHLAPLVYVDPDGKATEEYPYNPNGSPKGCAALCSPDGRHLAMMPHPERAFLKWQWPWMPEKLRTLATSAWLTMFQNARDWCLRG